MNIAFFHSNGIIPTSGGISRITYNLCLLFREKGHEVWLIADKNLNEAYEYDKNTIFLPNQETTSDENKQYLKHFLLYNKIDVIINQDPFHKQYVSLLAYCRGEVGVKIISCYHNSILTPIYHFAYQKEYNLKKSGKDCVFSFLKKHFVRNILIWLYIKKYRSSFLFTFNNSDAITILCDGQIDEYKRMTGISNNPKITVIPNYLAQITKGNFQKNKIVLWVGTFDYSIKRPDYMLQIWSKVESIHPEWSLYLLGDGSSLTEMKNLANKLNLGHVVFTGRVNPESYYQTAELQCVTSVHEAFSMVSIEAMAHSIPVLAFDSFTSAPFIIKDGNNGKLIDHFDIDKFADTLSELMSNDEIRKTMGKEALESSTRFSADNIYKLWNHLFNQILAVSDKNNM